MDAKITNVNKMGFFAEVGPLNIFVSSHLIPIEYRFQPEANPPEFVSASDRLVKGRKVRIKIVGTRVDANEIFAIGTMKEDYLGPLTSMAMAGAVGIVASGHVHTHCITTHRMLAKD